MGNKPMKRTNLVFVVSCVILACSSLSVSVHNDDATMTSCEQAMTVALEFSESGVHEQLLAMSKDECMAVAGQHSMNSFRELLEDSEKEPLLIEVSEGGGVTYIWRPTPPAVPPPHSHDHDEYGHQHGQDAAEIDIP